MLGRLPPFFLGLGILASTIASGSIECAHVQRSATEERGAQLYGRMCAVCHGAVGEGYKADQAPAIAHPQFLASVTDDYLRTAITQGRSGTNMSAWGDSRGGPLTRPDVDAIIAYMRTWQSVPTVKLDERPVAGNAARGAPVFARECAKCHGDKGTGGSYEGIGNRDILLSATNGFFRHAIRLGRSGTAMPAFEASLGDPAIDDTIALLRSWQFPPPPPRSTEPAARPPPLPLGPVPLNPHGPEPVGFEHWPKPTSIDIVKPELDKHARIGILDARAPTDYANEHIAGAVSVPFYDPSPYVDRLPRDAWLVCYCACPSAESGMLAKALTDKGFTKVTVLAEGLNAWRGRRFPTHTGPQP